MHTRSATSPAHRCAASTVSRPTTRPAWTAGWLCGGSPGTASRTHPHTAPPRAAVRSDRNRPAACPGRHCLLQEKADRAEPGAQAIIAKVAEVPAAQLDRHTGAASATHPTARAKADDLRAATHRPGAVPSRADSAIRRRRWRSGDCLRSGYLTVRQRTATWTGSPSVTRLGRVRLTHRSTTMRLPRGKPYSQRWRKRAGLMKPCSSDPCGTAREAE